MPLPEETQKFTQLVQLLKDFNGISYTAQDEMSRVMIGDPANKKELEKQLAETENQMMERMDKAAMAFISVFPLASMNRVNMFLKDLVLHANLTGDDTMFDVMDEINKEIFANYDCN